MSGYLKIPILSGGGGASAAADVTNVPSGNLSATDVQSALNELQSDIDGIAGSPAFSDTFNATTDWTLNGTDYDFEAPVSSHLKGINPTVSVYMFNGVLYEEVSTVVTITTIGDVTVKVNSTPDNRFLGKIVII